MGRPNHHTTRIDANPPPYRTCDSHRIRLAQRLQNPSRAFYSTSPLQSSIKLAFPSKSIRRRNKALIPYLFLSALRAQDGDSCFKTKGLKHSSFEAGVCNFKTIGFSPPAGWALPSSIVCLAWLRPEPRRHDGGRRACADCRDYKPTPEATRFYSRLDIDGESL